MTSMMYDWTSTPLDYSVHLKVFPYHLMLFTFLKALTADFNVTYVV